ncbi:tRNA pseudouridine(38-40) synthase TruA [Thalassoroseus pseudoceratinae]|uniref:tRNA pseudouridine(38-40) synthase TruA n=1 Tax=Thalassoroseus pseudoceratinae TaxID=2713176 RepID=UPI001422CB3F|nr:tRNA pseudouridine(38-40) synthase TruA [Thalassoroseus pseudoceratinae]
MRNLRLTIAYDGTNYVGWQVQPNGTSVQSVVESAIEKLTGESVRILAAGRTDSGVHALGQVVSFPTNSRIPADQFRRGLQNFLPDDVVVRESCDVGPEFHATYSAVRKRYRYVILNRREGDAFLGRFVWPVRQRLNLDHMRAASQHLIGTHDFRCFESHWPNKATSVRTIFEAKWGRSTTWSMWEPAAVGSDGESDDQSGSFLWFEVVADGFLYNMVRAIVGTLVKVGRGRWEPDRVRTIIDQQDRSQAGETAPACGLYLVNVEYPDQS